jgi:hypothetical protein
MHPTPNGIRALVGLWVLAGLAVSGLNGHALMTLLDDPIASYSNDMRRVDRGFREYRMLLSAEAQKITAGMEHLASRFGAAAVEIAPPALPVPPERPQAAAAAPQPLALPTLNGILTSRSSSGSDRRLALLDGRVYAEGDRIRDLTVKGITPQGVLLIKGDGTWFLKAPEIAYSLTTQ